MFDASSRKLSKIRTSAGIFCSLSTLHASCLFLQGCGVVGDILPPTLNLPMRAADMTAQEHGDKVTVAFKMPETTTEGQIIRHPTEIELRIGRAPADPNAG